MHHINTFLYGLCLLVILQLAAFFFLPVFQVSDTPPSIHLAAPSQEVLKGAPSSSSIPLPYVMTFNVFDPKGRSWSKEPAQEAEKIKGFIRIGQHYILFPNASKPTVRTLKKGETLTLSKPPLALKKNGLHHKIPLNPSFRKLQKPAPDPPPPLAPTP